MLTPEKLNELAMNYDPFPALQAINQASSVGTNFVTVPPPEGVQPATQPGGVGPFTSFINPQQNMPQAPQQPAPLDPRSLALLGSMQPQAPRPPAAVAPPAPGKAVQLNAYAPPAPQTRRPTMADLFGGR
jgi:hypothetical protein